MIVIDITIQGQPVPATHGSAGLIKLVGAGAYRYKIIARRIISFAVIVFGTGIQITQTQSSVQALIVCKSMSVLQPGFAEYAKQAFHPVLLLIVDGGQWYTFVRYSSRRIENAFSFFVVINTKIGDQFKLIAQLDIQVYTAQKAVERIFSISEAGHNSRIGVAKEIHLFVPGRPAIVFIIHIRCSKGGLHQR